MRQRKKHQQSLGTRNRCCLDVYRRAKLGKPGLGLALQRRRRSRGQQIRTSGIQMQDVALTGSKEVISGKLTAVADLIENKSRVLGQGEDYLPMRAIRIQILKNRKRVL